MGQIITGSTPSTKDSGNYSSNDYCFIKPSDLPINNIGRISFSEYYLSNKGYKLSRHLPKGTVLVSCIGSIGKIGILEVEATCNQQINAIIPNINIDSCYLAYSIYSIKEEMIRKANAPVVPIINKTDFSSFQVPVPPKEVQIKIVTELDSISESITLLQKQVNDLDCLAHSIFYDMFGDPVENEKNWSVKILKDVSTLLNGRAYKQDELLSEGKYKVLRVGNFFTNSSYYYSDLELEENKYCNKGDLLFAWSASFGAFIWSGEKVIYHYHIWKVLYDKSFLNIVFYQYLLNLMTNSFMKDLHGIGMMHLTKVGMEQYKLPIPPLSLQQSFANKIAAIEESKASLNAQIAEMQNLLAARMQYWFE